MNQVAVSIEEAAEALSLGRTKIYELIRQGHLKTTKIGRRRLVLVSSILELVEGE